jgi:hypothetical protein
MQVRPTPNSFSGLTPHFLVFLLLLWLVCPAVSPAVDSREDIPEALQPWIPWVLHGQDERTCTLQADANATVFCTWPSRLVLQVVDRGAEFSQEWEIESRSLVVLPGQKGVWPEAVRSGAVNLQVLKSGDQPAVWLEKGHHLLTGQFTWSKMPEYITVPPASGMIDLTINKRAVATPAVENDGRLWLRARAAAPAVEEESASVQVYRRVVDSLPLVEHLALILTVSGSPREIELGLEIKEPFVPLQVHSPLPIRLNQAGHLVLQAKPGQWDIGLTLRYTGKNPPAELAIGLIGGGLWADEEIWAFEADPRLRQVVVEGGQAIDPSRTAMPPDWQGFPAYILTAGDRLRLSEKFRGNPNPYPNRLNLHRTLWLDDLGGGLTVNDRLDGSMTRDWRLNVLPEQQLGTVEVEGAKRMITRIGDGRLGVEVRQGNLLLTADSRIERKVSAAGLGFAATGWDHTFQNLSLTLNLPPGWKLLAASGVDQAATWLTNWTLMDIFLVLILALATARLLGLFWGLLALVAFVLIYHQPNSPHLLVLPLLASMALSKILPGGRAGSVFRGATGIFFALLAISAIPFMVQEIRVGIYPQLEQIYQAPMPVASQDAARVEEMADKEMALAPAPSQAMKSRQNLKMPQSMRYDTSAEAPPEKIAAFDPDAMVQTGPGLPSWTWRSVALSWNGPVQPSQRVQLILLSPQWNCVLAFVRVILLALLFAGLLRQMRKSGGLTGRAVVGAMSCLCLPLLLLLFSAPVHAESQFPTKELLDELRERVLEPPDCQDNCAHINKGLVTVKDDLFSLDLEIHTAARSAVPIPGGGRIFDEISVDGKPADSLRRDEAGILYVRLEPGIHHLLCTKDLKESDSLDILFPLPPARGEVAVGGWEITGVHEDGVVDQQLSLRRIKSNPAGKRLVAEDDRIEIPAFFVVERTLRMGLKWAIETRISRRSPENIIIAEIPLLPGEQVTSDSLRIKGGKVQVNLGPQDDSISWTSVIEPVDNLSFTAPVTSIWNEIWYLDISPIWHIKASGLPDVSQINAAGMRYQEYRPRQGEKLTLAVSRPERAPGPTMTVNGSHLLVSPGMRETAVQLDFSLDSSRGGRHDIILPEGVELQKTTINGKEIALQMEGGKMTIPVSPGKQQIMINWRTDKGVASRLVSPVVNLGIASVNFTAQMNVPDSRWILLAGGPRLGPAVLFWGEILVIILLAVFLGRIRLTPLSTLQWFLLGLGLSQVSAPVAATVILWLFLLGIRKEKGAGVTKRFSFNAMQVLLVFATLCALASLFTAVEQGLLGTPDMQIGGNGSYGHNLIWYQDRSTAILPTAWVFSVPILVYRLLMLLWALWLAVSLLSWLRWGWQGFSEGGCWRRKPPKPVAPVEENVAAEDEKNNEIPKSSSV